MSRESDLPAKRRAVSCPTCLGWHEPRD